MTIKKYYSNGKLAGVGFDSLEEVYAYRHKTEELEDIPSNESKVKDINKIREDEGFKKWVEEME